MQFPRLIVLALTLVCLDPSIAPAQDQPAAPASSQKQLLKPQELDALVAPIALYPDTLLSLVLMASTYPTDVQLADRWVKQNSALTGDSLKAAADKQSWDESVKSLVAAPDVLAMLSTNLEWSVKLGDAVLTQQPDVMDAVQRMRARADAKNTLTTTTQQRIVRTPREGGGGRQVIAIEQVDPETLYVPYYDPAVAYGAWPYSDYPPYYFGYPGYIGAGVIAAGLAFGTGWALARWGTGSNFWGGGVNWNRNNIIANRPRVNPLGGNNWQRQAGANRAGNRMDFRGRNGNQVLKPGSGRGNAGQRRDGGRNNAGQRGGRNQVAHRSSGRQGAGNRSGNRQRAATRGHQRVAHRGARPGGGRVGSHGGRARAVGGGGMRAGGGGGFRGGGGRGGGRGGGGRGGGRRSDVNLKHDIHLLGYLPNGLGYYRFSYNGSERPYVGVMAQEVQPLMPAAVSRDRDGWLRVDYNRVGVKFQTYKEWIATGARIPGDPR